MRYTRPILLIGALALAACGDASAPGEPIAAPETSAVEALTTTGVTEPTEPSTAVTTTEATPAPAPTTPATSAQPTTTALAPTPTPETTMPTPPSDEVVQGDLVQAAIADLAEMTGASAGDITVVSVEEVTWPDGSIGCPQPDMAYTQALVDGSKIILSYAGIQYPYHQAAGGAPFYCSPTSSTK